MKKSEKDFWAGRKVLVTGHEGFLGSWLTKMLVERGAEVTGLDKVKDRPLTVLKDIRSRVHCLQGDIAHSSLVKNVINEFKPSIVFHLAAQAIVGEANKDPLGTFKSNIEGTWNIIEACRGQKFIEGIVAASSDKAYGSHRDLPYKEETPLQGEHPYDVSKSCADLLCRSYFISFNVPVCITRCGNIFGPGDHNFSRLVPDLIRHILKKEQFVIRSDGKFTRDYIYVEDVASGYLLLAEALKKKKLAGEAFNFSNEKPLSVLKFFEAIYKASGQKKITPKILDQAKYEIRHQYLSSKKAKKILGWKPKHGIEEGLGKTLAWYGKNLASIA